MTRGLICSLCGFAVLSVALVGCRMRKQQRLFDPTRAYVDARTTLRQAAEDPDPRVRSKALEALAATEGAGAGAIMLQSLRDDYEPVRYAAAIAVGDVRYRPAKKALLAMIKDSADSAAPPKLRCALIYALHRIGDDTYTSELGQMLQNENKWVRATAAMVMGRMGKPSAKGPLENIQRTDHEFVVQLQVVESLAALGDERSVTLLESYARSQQYEDSVTAILALGRLGKPRSVFRLRQLLDDSGKEPAVRVAAAGSLARLGEEVKSDLVLQAVTDPEHLLREARGRKVRIRPIEIASLQTIAILALGYVGEPDAVDTLIPLLRSPNGAVRVAAAKTVLKLLRTLRATAEPTHQLKIKETTDQRRTTRPASEPRLHTAGGKD